MNQLSIDVVGDTMVNTRRRDTDPQLEWADPDLPATSSGRVLRAPLHFENVHPSDAFTLPADGPAWVRINGIPYLKGFVSIVLSNPVTGAIVMDRLVAVPLVLAGGAFLNPGSSVPAGGKFQAFRQGGLFDLASLPNGVYSAWIEVDPLNQLQAYANTSKLWKIEAYSVKDYVP